MRTDLEVVEVGELVGITAPGGDLEVLRARWLVSLHADTTRVAYAGDLAVFVSWCHARSIDPLCPTRPAVDLWLTDMKAAGLKPTTRARRLAALRSFFTYAVDDTASSSTGRSVTVDPTARVRPPRVSTDAVKVALTLAEVRLLLAELATAPHHTRAAVGLMLGCALRVSEAAGVVWSDITHMDGHTVLTVLGKGERLRRVVVAPWVLELIEPVNVMAGPVVAMDGDTVDRHQMAYMVRSVARAAGITRTMSPHILRHTAATLSLDGGASVVTVSDLLGHSSPATTMRYVAGRERLLNSAAYVLAGVIAGGGR